jgi:hypothetical protein
VIWVPPAVVPEVGLTCVTLGAGRTYVKALALMAARPPGFVKTTSPVAFRVDAPRVHKILRLWLKTLFTTQGTPRTVTSESNSKSEPLIVSWVPPSIEALAGRIEEMMG